MRQSNLPPGVTDRAIEEQAGAFDDTYNEPAFPCSAESSPNGITPFPGMTLRDYFAAKALQGLLTCAFPPQSDPGMYARDAYALADAMLEERGK